MIPDYQSIMLPLLRHVSDKGEHKFRAIIEGLANKFGLTDEERKELLPSGIQPIFQNRVGWAKTYLKKAGLIDTPKRATVTITIRGLEILKQNLDSINVKFLKQFPEFVEFQTAKKGDEGIDGTIKEDKLGLDIIYIQAKRWQPGNVVGRPELQKFVGALAGQGAKKGIFITTSSFTRDALDYVPRNEPK